MIDALLFNQFLTTVRKLFKKHAFWRFSKIFAFSSIWLNISARINHTYSNFQWDFASFETPGAGWILESQFENLKDFGIKNPTVWRRWRRLRLAFPFHSILMPDGCFSTPMVLFSTHTYCATTTALALLCLS